MNQHTQRPEAMAAFFDARTDGYDAHMRAALGDLFEPYYGAIAAQVAAGDEPVDILDLGAGTGAEIVTMLERAPRAHFTCVDLSAGMLERLAQRFAAQRDQLTLVHGSYLEVPAVPVFTNTPYNLLCILQKYDV